MDSRLKELVMGTLNQYPFSPVTDDKKSAIKAAFRQVCDDENVVKAIEAFMDGATDEEVKSALGVKRVELARIKNCLRDYFELKLPEKQPRKSNV